MTSPLPTPSKPTPAEGARPDMGNFFQFLPSPKGNDSSKTDFESFLNQKNPAQDLQEEREAAKSRKKSVDAAAIAAPPQEIPATPRVEKPESGSPTNTQTGSSETNPTQPADPPAAENSAKPIEEPANSTPENSAKAPEDSAKASEDSAKVPEESDNSQLEVTAEDIAPASDPDGVQTENPTDSVAELSEESQPESAKSEQSNREPEPDPSDANGMETAPLDSEMISLATFDGVESGAATSREPSITSIHRLAAFAAPDRNGLAPIGASGNSADSGLGQLATGQNAPIDSRSPSPTSPTAQATALFKSLGPELEKFRQTGRNQVQLDIPVSENESVRIRLSLRAGELRSTFITESPELRDALQKAWPEFAQNSRERGFRLGDPNFQQGFPDNGSAFGQNARRDKSSTDFDQQAVSGSSASRKSTPARSSSNQTSTALWA